MDLVVRTLPISFEGTPFDTPHIRLQLTSVPPATDTVFDPRPTSLCHDLRSLLLSWYGAGRKHS